MKKLIMAIAVAALAAATQAAVIAWKTGTGNQVYLMNSTDRAGGLAVYLFADTVTQDSVLEAVRSGAKLSSLAYKATSTTQSTGAINSSFTANAGDTFSGYFAILATVDGADYLYISSVASATAPTTGTGTAIYKEKAASQLAASSGTYSGAGWYTTAAVPEPTSAMLLVLGVAALALRRKRA